MIKIYKIVLLIGLLFGSVLTLHAAESGNGYQLGPGDRVKVTVFGHQDLSGEFDLDARGRISMPLIQSVNAYGLNRSELESLITNSLRPDYLINPRVSVDILSYRPFYIVGEVRNAGDFPYQANLTIIKAIALAGGYSERANKKKVYITRSNDTNKKKKLASPDTVVLPGDIISIPQRYF